MLSENIPLGTLEDLYACIGHPVAIDIETTGLKWWEDKLIGIGYVCPPIGKSGYIPALDEETRGAVRGVMRLMTDNLETCIIAHNLAFESLFLGLSPRRAACLFLDTMVMAHLHDSRQRKNLEAVAARYLQIPEAKRIFREAGRNRPIHEWPLDLTARYCVNDCAVEFHLAETLMPLLRKDGLEKLLRKDMRYLGLLIEVMRRGMLVDQNFIARAETVIAANVVLMERDLKASVGTEFNWRSTPQLSKALYEHMGIEKPVNPYLDEFGVDINKGKSAQFNRYNSACTSSFLLMEKAHHPLGNLVLDLRESDKLVRNYLRQWKELIAPDGAIHGGFNITGTRTGRLSSSRPNLQNLPGEIRTRETQSVYSGGALRANEYNLRQAFVARPDHIFLSVDYKQQEGRLFALIANDPQMIAFVRGKKDIHGEVAESAWGTRDKVHREWAKTISFSILYGATAGSIQHRLNKTPDEARAIMSDYYARFPRILPFMNEVIRNCTRDGYVRNWAGRIWRESNPGYAYRATNFLCQGGGADLLSIGALRCQDWLEENDAGSIVSFIHDEILCEVPVEMLGEAAEALKSIAEVEDIFNASFLTECKAGTTYGTLEAL